MSEATSTAKRSTTDFFDFLDLAPEHASGSNVLLIDLENCPHQINELLHQLKHYSRMVICYAQSGAKVPLAWLEPLSQALQSQKLQISQKACSTLYEHTLANQTLWRSMPSKSWRARAVFEWMAVN